MVMDNDYLDLDVAAACGSVKKNIRNAVAGEILGYLGPHVEGLRSPKERQFVQDMIYRRARSMAEGTEFWVSKAQWTWLVKIAYVNGFRARDEAFWQEHRPQQIG